ncbi:MAG TPA: FIST N-terminal domain-containing protein, partial [Polyangiaceae bacterium]|nr:FIST N-terminal domain-containing protein [Polyangiaceae bacterium]
MRDALADAGSPSFALLFATDDYLMDEVAVAATRALGGIPWAGVATPGVLHTKGMLEQGIAVGVVESELVRVRVGVASALSADPREAGRRAAREALADMPLPPENRSRLMLLFADPTSGDADVALAGAVSVGGAGIAWAGGGGGRTGVVFAHGRALRDSVLTIALDCVGRVGVGVQHGWEPTGAPTMVTRASGVVVAELEHRPALEIYREAVMAPADLGGRSFAEFAISHPLGIPQARGEYLIRDPVSVDANGAIELVASVPDGALIRVMRGTPELLVEAAGSAARSAKS